MGVVILNGIDIKVKVLTIHHCKVRLYWVKILLWQSLSLELHEWPVTRIDAK